MMAIGDRSSPEKSSSPNGIWLIRELSLDRAVGAARSSATTDAGGAAPAHSCRPARPVFGLCCRQLDGAVRQQCAGHLPFERRATANGVLRPANGNYRPRPGIRTSPKPPLSTGVFCEFRCHEAAVRDLTTPANCGRSTYRNHGHSGVRSAPKPVGRSTSVARPPVTIEARNGWITQESGHAWYGTFLYQRHCSSNKQHCGKALPVRFLR